MTTTRVLLLDAAGPESAALIATAAARRWQVHVATGTGSADVGKPELRTAVAGFLETDFARPEHAAGDIVDYARRIGADAVLTTNEYLTPLVAEICAALDLPGNDPALARAARDKTAMVRQFDRHGVTTPHTRVVDDTAHLHRLAATGQMRLPWVIKPADAAGSAGVTIVTDQQEAAAAFHTAHATPGRYGTLPTPRVVVQHLVPGVEYSVESVTQNGSSTHLCVTHKKVTDGTHRVELGHGLPALLPATVEHSMYRQVELALAAVGIRNGLTHTEVIVTPDGRPTVIEVAARIGSGHIGFLIQHALGLDPWALCLDTALGQPTQLTPSRNRYATVRFLTAPRPGRLIRVTGLPDRSPHVPIVRIRTTTGTIVNGTDDNTDRLGSIVVVGPDRHTAEQYARDLLAQVQIDIDPCPAAQPLPGQPHSR